MGKRFTDTDKWKKPFIRGLNGAYKLLWFYICDDCDHAGIWQVDIEVAMLRIGEEVTVEGALKAFGDKVMPLENGAKWFIPPFIDFQYPSGLNPGNNAHAGTIKVLNKYNLLEKNKPLMSPSQGAQEKDKEMDKDNTITRDDEIKRQVKHLSITVAEHAKLIALGYTVNQVEEIYNAIENYKKITNYTSLYLTALKWLKKEFPQVLENQKKQAIPVADDLDISKIRPVQSVF